MTNIIDEIIENAESYLQKYEVLPNCVKLTDREFREYKKEVKNNHKPIIDCNGQAVVLKVRRI